MNLRPIKRHTTTDIDADAESFGVVDKQGRDVGFKWAITSHVVEIYPEGEGPTSFCPSWPEDRPLAFIHVWGSPTRNGRNYGASDHGKRFAPDALEEARKYVAKRIADARKRELKRFGNRCLNLEAVMKF